MRLAEERPQLAKDRKRYVFYPGTSTVSNKIAPRLLNRPHSITATVEHRRTAPRACSWRRAARRAAIRSTSRTARLHYAYNYLGVQQLPRRSSTDASPRAATSCASSSSRPAAPDLAHGKGTPGRAQLYIDGKLAAQADLPVTIPLDIGITEGLTCGRDEGSSVTDRLRRAVCIHRHAGAGRGRRLG